MPHGVVPPNSVTAVFAGGTDVTGGYQDLVVRLVDAVGELDHAFALALDGNDIIVAGTSFSPVTGEPIGTAIVEGQDDKWSVLVLLASSATGFLRVAAGTLDAATDMLIEHGRQIEIDKEFKGIVDGNTSIGTGEVLRED